MKKLICLGCFSISSILPASVTMAQTAITPGGVIIQQPGAQGDSTAQQLAICIKSLNSVQNESEGTVTLYGSLRTGGFVQRPYRYVQPSNISNDEMNRVGLRHREGDVWIGDVPSVTVRATNANNLNSLSNREIMELCLQRTPQFSTSPTPAAQPPYYAPPAQPATSVAQPPYYAPQPSVQPPAFTPQSPYYAPPAQPTTSVAQPPYYAPPPSAQPPLTPQPAGSTILMVGNPSQPVAVDIAAQISASLAGRGLSPVACNLNPGVTVLVGEYMACAYPTPSYPAGRYTLR